MRKPRTYGRKRTKRTRTKITKLHILIMATLVAILFIGLIISLIHIIYINTKDTVYANHANITPNISVNRSVAETNVITNNISERNDAIYIKKSDLPNVSIAANDTLNTSENDSKISIVFTEPDSAKPKLAIIIDDMTNDEQVKDLLSIPVKLTPSFLPPKKDVPNSPMLAEQMEFYMVHLPSEALNFRSEPITLLVSDTYEEILGKLKRFKQEFPRGIYFNNHTGSKFTADFEAMNRLFAAMDELGLIFVDSRTTSQTQAPKIARKFGKNLLQRDIFLDNEIENKAIKKQLRLAINEAKKKGFAIAIGHPHKKTFESINSSMKALSEVEVVYVKDL